MTATFSRVASADVQKAYDWYEAQRQGLGSEFLGRVEQAVARIERNPLAYGKVVLDARRVNLQQFPYTLFYKIRESGEIVIACLHHRRDPGTISHRARSVIEFPES